MYGGNTFIRRVSSVSSRETAEQRSGTVHGSRSWQTVQRWRGSGQLCIPVRLSVGYGMVLHVRVSVCRLAVGVKWGGGGAWWCHHVVTVMCICGVEALHPNSPVSGKPPNHYSGQPWVTHAGAIGNSGLGNGARCGGSQDWLSVRHVSS